MGRILGIGLLVGGVVVGIIIVVLMGVYRSENSLTAGAATLGAVLGFLVLVLPQLGVGAFLLWKGQQETAVASKAAEQRKLLDMLKTQGQLDIGDAVIQLQSTRDDVHNMLYQLVGMGLFSGYINWDEGMLYSKQAQELKKMTNCYNCGGELELAGQGVIRCPYCGTEYFLES